MKIKNTVLFISLAVITVIILTVWSISLKGILRSNLMESDERNMRLTLSEAIGFMKTNWHYLEDADIQNELLTKLEGSNSEVILYDSEKHKLVFVYGDYAKKVSRTNIEEMFGLKDKETVDGGNYKQLTWLIYNQDVLLGVAKIYIPQNHDNNSFFSLYSKLLIVSMMVFIPVLGIWILVLSRVLKRKQKVIDTMNMVTKRLAQGDFEVSAAISEENKEIKESLLFFDRMRQDLKEMIKAKEEHEESRKILINYLMHDIRTPVASMRVLTEGLLDGIPKTEEAKLNYYEGLKKKITELEKLTDDLFHHVNIEVGAMAVSLEEVYCDEAMSPVFAWLNTLQGSFGGSLEIDHKIPHVLVRLDVKRMEQVLVNLITNAVKYSKEGGSIIVRIEREENMVVFQVEDNGYGISKEDLPFVFEHFYRGEKSRNRKHGGTGLGLSIVKYIVEAHGGYITVKSQLDTGSLFKVYIPVV